jgi:hypothetical protein
MTQGNGNGFVWECYTETAVKTMGCPSKLLMDQGFVCAWNNNGDGNNSKKHYDDAEMVKATSTVVTNWETSHPPAMHWSGTIVDYSYGRNILAVAVSISPAGWSDHRMTVCDWT